ncbi:nuclease-related domain-containing protein [Lysinibacillus sp. G4S2]|uniref:nuclease-related domain-containing protein n=1 Tax=Lysinibacillus sp. G4S2 TaxID=3055859 RepID=UPI0025A2A09F|nr:nuclease-related domain-containing protein [Lysinibacillus sp. G4S2]MDM5247720.1 nuclease-related domain-containing protein [Lysinibacillus sp. G4S2]
MILLDRQESEEHKILEALVRRLTSTHTDYMNYFEKLRRIHAGFAGEQRVDAEWLEIILPQPHYFLNGLQILNHFGTTHQIDTILLCPQFILILEIKNVTGFLDFDESFNQFTRTKAEGDVEGMTNPLHQSRRHMEWMMGMLQQSRLKIPVHYAVVLATKNAILSKSLRGQPIFHVSGLRYHVRELHQRYKETVVDEEKLFQFASKLLSMHMPIKREIAVPVQDLIKGVLCESCLNGQTMNYCYPKWYCQRCGAVDQEAIFRTLEDYRLLVGETLTNKSFCEFFKIDSPNTAYKLLQKLPLKPEGTKRNRKYWIEN